MTTPTPAGIMRSTDGLHYTLVPLSDPFYGGAIGAGADGLVKALGQLIVITQSNIEPRIWTSSNGGLTWTPRPNLFDGTHLAHGFVPVTIVATPSAVVVAGHYNYGTSVIYSSDGTTFNTSDNNLSGGGPRSSTASSDRIFIGAGNYPQYDSFGSPCSIMYSTDGGVSFTALTGLLGPYHINAMGYGAGTVLAGGVVPGFHLSASTDDGVTWTTISSYPGAYPVSAISYDATHGRWIVACQQGPVSPLPGTSFTSTDLVHWSNTFCPIPQINAVEWIDALGLWVAVGQSPYSVWNPADPILSVSTDGTTWTTPHPLPIGGTDGVGGLTSSLQCIAWDAAHSVLVIGGEMLVAPPVANALRIGQRDDARGTSAPIPQRVSGQVTTQQSDSIRVGSNTYF
jgi:hypothetical protein